MAEVDALLRAGFLLGILEEHLSRLQCHVLLGSESCTLLGKMRDLQTALEEIIEDDLK